MEIVADGQQQYRWIHANHSYKSGGALEAHFGLGKATSANVKVMLPSGKTVSARGIAANRRHTIELGTP